MRPAEPWGSSPRTERRRHLRAPPLPRVSRISASTVLPGGLPGGWGALPARAPPSSARTEDGGVPMSSGKRRELKHSLRKGTRVGGVCGVRVVWVERAACVCVCVLRAVRRGYVVSVQCAARVASVAPAARVCAPYLRPCRFFSVAPCVLWAQPAVPPGSVLRAPRRRAPFHPRVEPGACKSSPAEDGWAPGGPPRRVPV